MNSERALARTSVVVVAAASLVASALFFGRPAQASFHLMKIVEVYQGGQQDSEFVELQMHANGQNGVAGKSVTVFGPDGAQTGKFTFPNNVSNGANQAHILLATSAAEQEFFVEADLEITESIQFFGGAVCFEDIDCVAWGEYSGNTSKTGSPFSPQDGLDASKSMTRDTSGGNNPSRLDAGDDTDNSAADFDHAQPTPTSNSSSGPSPSGTGASPSNTASPSPQPDGPNAEATIERPRWKGTYKAGELLVFKGTGSHPSGEEFVVTVALKQSRKDGTCKWLTRRGTFVKDGCKSPRGHYLRASGSDRWSYRLEDPLAASRGGRITKYTLFARADCNCTSRRGRVDDHPFEIR